MKNKLPLLLTGLGFLLLTSSVSFANSVKFNFFEAAQCGDSNKTTQSAFCLKLQDTEARDLLANRDYFVVIGSFLTERSAQKETKRFPKLTPKIAKFDVKGQLRYRLILGPYDKPDAKKAQFRATQEGVVGAWPLKFVSQVSH